MKISLATTPRAFDFVRSKGISASASPADLAKRIIKRRTQGS